MCTFSKDRHPYILKRLKMLTFDSRELLSSHGAETHGLFCPSTGDSGIVAVGTSDGFDGTGTTYPANNDISNNHIHEIGVYGKQTSCYFQALGQNNRFANNLCYNGTALSHKRSTPV